MGVYLSVYPKEYSVECGSTASGTVQVYGDAIPITLISSRIGDWDLYAGFNPVSGDPPFTSKMIVNAAPWCLEGTYELSIMARDRKGNTVASDKITVHVRMRERPIMPRYRPIVGGCTIGHFHIEGGTYSCRVFDRTTGERLILGSNHVIALHWGQMQRGQRGDSILQPAAASGGNGGSNRDKVGELERWVNVNGGVDNFIDCAVAKITIPEGSTDDILKIGSFGPARWAEVGMRVMKMGEYGGYAEAIVEIIDATIYVTGYGSKCRFVNQTLTADIVYPGDSGSMAIAKNQERSTLGHYYASGNEIAVFCNAHNIRRLLNIDFVKGEAPPEPPPEPPPPPPPANQVTLSARNVPSGVTIGFNPEKGIPGFKSIMTLNVGAMTKPGNYSVLVVGTTPDGIETELWRSRLTILGAGM